MRSYSKVIIRRIVSWLYGDIIPIKCVKWIFWDVKPKNVILRIIVFHQMNISPFVQYVFKNENQEFIKYRYDLIRLHNLIAVLFRLELLEHELLSITLLIYTSKKKRFFSFIIIFVLFIFNQFSNKWSEVLIEKYRKCFFDETIQKMCYPFSSLSIQFASVCMKMFFND